MAARRSRRSATAKPTTGEAAATAGAARSVPRGFRTALLAAALVAIAANAYAPVFRCGYVWDDDSYVTGNPTLQTADGLRRIWFEPSATPQYYPLVFTSFWLEYQLFGLNPAASHAINVLLHCGGAVLAWRVLLALGLPGPVAWLAALVFGVHPVNVESVAWITERKNVLSGVCYLGALLAYLKFDRLDREPPEAGADRNRWRYYVLSWLLFIGALLSKTVTASLPVVILLLVWYRRGRVSARDVARVVPFLVLGIVLGGITVWLERQHVGAVGEEWDLGPLDRVLLAGRAAWFYAGKILWPRPLVFVYPRWQIDSSVAWQYLYPAAALALVAVLWRMRGAIGRGPLVAVLCFAVTLAPALGFVNVYPMRYSYVADHFQYLASLAVIVLVAGSVWKLYERAAPNVRAIVGVLCLAWLGTLVALTWQQTHDYNDVETLWTNTLAKNPNAWIAAHNLGVLHLERNQYPEAERFFRQVVAVHPNHARAQNNLGLLQLYKRDLRGAVARFETAIRVDPSFVGARLNLARIELAQGQVHKAVDQYLRALAAEPETAESQEPLGLEIMRAADTDAADQFLKDALRIRPNWPHLVSQRAWMLATSPLAERRDPAHALALARQAVEMSGGRDANTLDCLGAAYAASGQFPQAVDAARQALAEARRRGNVALAATIETRIQTYERGEPYVALDDEVDRPAGAKRP